MAMVTAMVHLGDDQDDDKDDNDDNDPYATEDHGGSGLSPALQMSHHTLVHRPIKRAGGKNYNNDDQLIMIVVVMVETKKTLIPIITTKKSLALCSFLVPCLLS